MDIAVFIYDGMTALDAIGPYEVLSRLPEAKLRFVAEEKGVVRTDTGALGIHADAAIAEVGSADLLLVPGGPGDERVRQTPRALEWLARIHQGTRHTTSVCTGSLILAAAGVLDGRRAVTHWARMDLLAELGAKPVKARWVEEGKIVTAAGVSAGIDMALHLAAKIAGEPLAKAMQLGLEYDPQPPFDVGSPEKAPPDVVALARAGSTARREEVLRSIESQP